MRWTLCAADLLGIVFLRGTDRAQNLTWSVEGRELGRCRSEHEVDFGEPTWKDHSVNCRNIAITLIDPSGVIRAEYDLD
jgi:hypothetical protein